MRVMMGVRTARHQLKRRSCEVFLALESMLPNSHSERIYQEREEREADYVDSDTSAANTHPGVLDRRLRQPWHHPSTLFPPATFARLEYVWRREVGHSSFHLLPSHRTSVILSCSEARAQRRLHYTGGPVESGWLKIAEDSTLTALIRFLWCVQRFTELMRERRVGCACIEDAGVVDAGGSGGEEVEVEVVAGVVSGANSSVFETVRIPVLGGVCGRGGRTTSSSFNSNTPSKSDGCLDLFFSLLLSLTVYGRTRR